ncbi:class I SAM-dependent methyltransferase [Tessaracoccus sp. OS52]|uniref:class I SAM-dependent methyltransferase n=1 Tax=Tessaracoccus sp. OS52 TaxID=2886691 RepID=UPI001D1019CC|nr:methyltransferase [Tessaracoccus sp. OS52]MCC2594267.1 class I SAM-dependent methyltransferase [Tessaracoccus sp. OS52]
MDPIDELILAETPQQATAIAVIDAPALVEHALKITDDVRVWCDDIRDAELVEERLIVEHPSDLHGVDLAWGHLPKSLGALDEQAVSIQGATDVTFLTGARMKHMNRTMNEVLGKHFAAVNATLGHRKSRALRAWGPANLESEWPKARHHDDLGLTIVAHGATFAGTKVDAGTRLLLQHLDVAGEHVLDFGSGNGVIAAVLARKGHRVDARDSSWSAVSATLETAQANELEVQATWIAGIADLPDGSLDAIVTNPPFHQGTTKDSTDTLEMFAEASRVLTPGGQLWCVYNSHLPYRRELNERVGRTRVVAQDCAYTVTFTENCG